MIRNGRPAVVAFAWLIVPPGCALAGLAAGGVEQASNNTLSAIDVQVLTLIDEWQLQECWKCLLSAIIIHPSHNVSIRLASAWLISQFIDKIFDGLFALFAKQSDKATLTISKRKRGRGSPKK
jgi:hypothetical protein